MALTVDASIPHGNVCDVEIEGGDPAEVRFSPHPHGGPECLWFCFRLVCTEPCPGRETVRLVLKHVYNMLGSHSPAAMRPVVRYGSEPWRRLGAPWVEELPDGRSRVVWSIPFPTTFVDVAYCYPYGRPEVEALVRETDGCWQADVIGVSQAGRPLLRLSNSYGEKGSGRPGLYLVARQHSGETPGSWVLDGFLRYMATVADEAPLVWAVPLTNIDGVERGDYGKDNFPYDLNRAWGTPPMRHEVLVFQRDVQRWRARCVPALAIDLHAPGACETSGIYAYVPDPAEYPEMHASVLAWTAALKGALTPEYAAATFERVADYPSRWATANFARYCWTQHDLCSVGIETPYALVGDRLLTRENYQEAGARMAAGVVSKLRVRGSGQ